MQMLWAINRRTGQSPIVLHAPGTLKRTAFWRAMTERVLGALDIRRPPESMPTWALVTWNSGETPCLLERCCGLLGVEPVVLGRGIEHWDSTAKGALLLEWLGGLTEPPEYLIGLDGFDILLLEHPGEIVRRFREMFPKQRLLFNAAAVQWPKREPLLDACRQIEERWPDGTDRYLNAGAFVGTTAMVRPFLKQVQHVARSEPWPRAMRHLEQHAVRYAAFPDLWPAVDVDRDCVIFQHMYSGRTDVELRP